MPSYTLAPSNGAQDFKSNQAGELYHDVAIRAVGTPVGTLVLTARKPGSQIFEAIPDGSFDLSALTSIQFTGAVTEYRADISGITGVTSLYLTDTAQRA